MIYIVCRWTQHQKSSRCCNSCYTFRSFKSQNVFVLGNSNFHRRYIILKWNDGREGFLRALREGKNSTGIWFLSTLFWPSDGATIFPMTCCPRRPAEWLSVSRRILPFLILTECLLLLGFPSQRCQHFVMWNAKKTGRWKWFLLNCL